MPIFKVSSKLQGINKLDKTYTASQNVVDTREKQIVEEYGNFAFASKFRFIATDMPENSTVEETFPAAPKGENKVEDMTTKQVDANYQNGAPVPPKN